MRTAHNAMVSNDSCSLRVEVHGRMIMKSFFYNR